MKNNSKKIKFHKQLILKLYGFLAIIPFIFALFPLLNGTRQFDKIIFSIGATFIILLQLTNILEPVAIITQDKIFLNNTFQNKPIILLKKDFESYKKISENLVSLTFNKKNYELKLSKKELKIFINLIKEFS